jgi:hypothetical protein
MTALKEWESFYVIVGSSAGALIGLQFVVMTLIAERPVVPTEALGKALATPTIVHLGAVLLLSSVLSAPWRGLAVAVVWGLLGLCGAIYVGIVARRVRAQAEYKPVLEDWLFHVLLPLLAYAILAASAFVAQSDLDEALFGVAAGALLLLFDGIHNAWDSIAYHVFAGKSGTKADP